jgi:adenylate cyclase
LATTDRSRRLTTIVALDVAGYSARTESDEARATAEVAQLKTVIGSIAQAHGGRVFNTAGDGFMLEFGSCMSAVEAASDLMERCIPAVRIGVHLGDVVVEPNGDLLGHGVNVAARLMAQSAPGSALVSADVRHTIRGSLAGRLASRGVIHLDKMEETIEAFVLRSAAVVSASPPLHAAEPLLVVLPFDNLSRDDEMQFFSDGVSEEIMQTVSRTKLKVIGRSSAFQFRGADKAVAKVAAALKVSHVLDGAVRRSGDRVRISAQLIETAGQTTLWSDTFDRQLNDVFAIQTEISGALANALGVALGVGSQAPGYGGTENFVAQDHFLKGRMFGGSEAPDDRQFQLGIEHLRQAVTIDPQYALAWAQISLLIANWFNLADRPDLVPERADAMQRALALAPELPAANIAAGWYQADRGHWLVADTAFARAVRRGPGHDPLAEGIYGGFLSVTGRAREALRFREAACAADPLELGLSGALQRCYAMVGLWDQYEAEYRRCQNLTGPRWGAELLHLLCLVMNRADGAAIDTQYDHLLQDPGMPRGLKILLTAIRTSPADAGTIIRRGLVDPKASLLLAQMAGAFGDDALALDAMRMANKEHSSQFQIVWMPQLRGARKLPGFKDLMRQVGLADFWRASNKWPDFVVPRGSDDFECI